MTHQYLLRPGNGRVVQKMSSTIPSEPVVFKELSEFYKCINDFQISILTNLSNKQLQELELNIDRLILLIDGVTIPENDHEEFRYQRKKLIGECQILLSYIDKKQKNS